MKIVSVETEDARDKITEMAVMSGNRAVARYDATIVMSRGTMLTSARSQDDSAILDHRPRQILGATEAKASKFEEVNKHLDVKVALRVGELREDVREDVRLEIRDVINELCRTVARGKQKVIPLSGSDQESGASGSDTEEISERTRKLCITEKRKQGPEPVFEGSPPMEQPPKRMPRRVTKPAKLTECLTRAKAKRQENMPAPKKTPPSIRKRSDAARLGMVKRLKFEKKIMKDLKGLDALVLQNICRDEGIPYGGKFESIFDIAAHRAQLAYGPESDEAESTELDDVSADVVEVTIESTEG
ncbi:hypothetical protein CBR_g36991 [Chara braunii]|uniref:Uncharacterized protein n=1 Tax=Chara braunii TaxID=69332 RepID=A0A388JZL1_CHABU|nr:hypothetical protein CBR_g36991 [Chara braunii]|eukprot:GBG63222.1 hypothetical protein CBR_g36991 [Chara braunii]